MIVVKRFFSNKACLLLAPMCKISAIFAIQFVLPYGPDSNFIFAIIAVFIYVLLLVIYCVIACLGALLDNKDFTKQAPAISLYVWFWKLFQSRNMHQCSVKALQVALTALMAKFILFSLTSKTSVDNTSVPALCIAISGSDLIMEITTCLQSLKRYYNDQENEGNNWFHAIEEKVIPNTYLIQVGLLLLAVNGDLNSFVRISTCLMAPKYLIDQSLGLNTNHSNRMTTVSPTLNLSLATITRLILAEPSQEAVFNWRLIGICELRRVLTRDTGKSVWRNFMHG